MENTKSASWKTIIILLIIFWPIGIYLIYKKMNSDKASVLQKSKTLNIVGWVFVFFAVVYFLEAITGKLEVTDGTSGVGGICLALIFFGGGGALMLYMSKKSNAKAIKIKKYISIVINNGQTSIDSIAAAMRMDYNQVVKDLTEMIDKGYFTNAYIDDSRREIILTQRQTSQELEADVSYGQNNIQGNTVSNQQFKLVLCKNCGANNKILDGIVSECEYCGTFLN